MKFHNQDVMYIRKVTLKVKDLDVMREFYTQTMGMTVHSISDSAVDLGTQDTVLLRLELLKNGIRSLSASGLYHVAYLLPSRSDLGSFLSHLAELNVPIGAGDHLVSEALYFNDPEGNGIEVYADRDDSLWTWQNGAVEMATDPVDFQALLHEAKAPWKNMPKGSVVGHVHLSVVDISANHHFYVDILQYQLVSRFGDQAEFVSDAKYHHHIAFNTWNPRIKNNANMENLGLKSMEIHLPSKEKRDALIQRLISFNYTIQEIAGNPSVLDPSNTEIVFVL